MTNLQKAAFLMLALAGLVSNIVTVRVVEDKIELTKRVDKLEKIIYKGE